MNPELSKTSYLPNLTPLRGIAALLTVIFHVDLMIGFGGNLLLKFKDSLLISKCYLMVDFFFVLSGFILMHVYQQWFKERVTRQTFIDFSIARFARIYPLHLLTLLYLVGLHIWLVSTGTTEHNPFAASSNTWISIPTNLLLIQSMNVHRWFTWNNVAWSISTEWWMYMIFPFLVATFLRLKTAARVAVVVFCIGGYFLIMFYLQYQITYPAALSNFFKNLKPSLNVAYQFGFFRCMFGFVLGMVTWLAFSNGNGKKIFGQGSTFLLLCLGLIACLHFGVWDVFSACFFPLIILSAAYGSESVNRIFRQPAMQAIGNWSFSIYMVHQPIMFTYATVTGYLHSHDSNPGPPIPPSMGTGWLICLAYLAATLLLAWLTYTFVEVPARKWINRKYSSTHRLPHVNTMPAQ